MKILLVAGGDIPIPPPAWGGVENVVYQQYKFLKQSGHEAVILNKKRRRFINGFLARPWRYDLVHLHIDSGARAWVPLQKLLRFKLAVTTHYGYAAFPERWQGKFARTFRRMLKVPHHIALSAEIRDTIVDAGYHGRAFVLPNGIICGEVRFDPSPAPRQALVLGRIQERKKQAFLGAALADSPVTCDLIGPSDDPAFIGNGRNVNFIGPWDRDKVVDCLTEYACMILISDGEAHAGVILEAMAAGLSLVISPEAAHNLDTSQPWVHVVDRDQPEQVVAAIEKAIAENPRYRTEIRRYCEATFDWQVIGPQYLSIIEDIIAGRVPAQAPPARHPA
jgi:glycosyltransferase involved in cell wall biosynthesis